MKVINGQQLKSMLISGGNNLYNHYPEVDALNVFPVPDGDTGMNMNLTMTSGAKEIQNRTDSNSYEIAKAFSRGLLMGARGNSGVITSQIFRGFSQGLEGKKDELTARDISDAFQKGVEVAYKAVLRPVEGTILTVARESSQYLHEKVTNATPIEKAFDLLIEEADRSLKRTPDLLPILKEVGVVDSGGAGLLKIFEGMREALKGNFIDRNVAITQENPLTAAGNILGEEEFGYCTEFIMRLSTGGDKKQFNEKRFISTLDNLGNSLVVVKDEDIVKVHVHTLKPGNALNYAQQFGEFIKLKIENMTEQHNNLESGAKDNSEPILEEPKKDTPRSKYALIAVSSGEGISQYFKEVGIEHIVSGGQTMNPSSEDFVQAIKKANADNVFIFPNNSNIVMAASQACEIVADEDVNAYVIPSKTILQGVAAAIMFNPEASNEENFNEMKAALKNVKSGEITFAIRDTDLNGVKVKKDDYIGIVEKEIVVDNPNKIEALYALIEKMADDYCSVLTIIFGEDVTKEEEETVKNFVKEKYIELDLDLRRGNQPVYSFLIGVE